MRSRAALVLAALAVLAAVAAGVASARPGASPAGVWVGTIGGDRIVLELGTGPDGLGDRLFRRGVGRDVPLDVRTRGAEVTAEERAPYGGALRSRLRLTLSGRTLRGTSVGIAGRSRPVVLRPAAAADLPAVGPDAPALAELRRTDLYTALKLDRPFARLRVARLAGRTVTWLREPRSGVVLPRLPGAGAVNDALADEHLHRALTALTCPVAGGWDERTRIGLLTRRVLSLRGYVYADCGGAHPDGFPTTATFDLTSGRAVALEDLYRVVPVPAGIDPATGPALEGPAFDRWIAYLERRGARLRSLALRAQPGIVRGRCWGGGLGDEWTFVTWHLSASGLVLQGDFPHVADVCDPVVVTLPWSLLRPFRVAGGPAPA